MVKRVYSDETREKRRLATQKWRQANPEKVRALSARPRNYAPGQIKRWNLLRYGITPEARDEIWAAQGSACVICRGDCSGKREPVIDHCHTTGRVRAMLCLGCNTALGLAKENPERLRALADYAEKWGSLI